MPTLEGLRRFLLVILILGLTGTGVELLLLEHHEGALQLVPLAILAAGLGVVVWHAATGSAVSAQAVRAVMILSVAAGVAGIYFHYQANVEFQLETDPRLAGQALFWRVVHAKAPPALAPGAMVQVGLIGLAYTHRGKER